MKNKNNNSIEITEMEDYIPGGENKGKPTENIIKAETTEVATKEITIEKITASSLKESETNKSEEKADAASSTTELPIIETPRSEKESIEESPADGGARRKERALGFRGKSWSPFFKKMAIVYIGLFTLLAIGLFIFSGFLKGYEDSLLKTAANNLLAEIEADPTMVLTPSKYEANHIPSFGELTYSEGLTEITIKSDGEDIATARFDRIEDGSFGFKNYTLNTLTPLIETESVSMLIDDSAEVYLNDVLVDSDPVTITAENEERLIDSPFTLSGVSTLTVEGLYGTPIISAGEGYSVVEVEGQTVVSKTLTSDEQERFLDAAINISNTYAKFITKDSSKSALTRLLYNGTSFEYDILYFDNSWYISHDSHEFLDESYEILYSVGNVVVAEVNFNYQIKKGTTIYDYPSRYFLYLTDNDGNIEALSIDVKNRD